MFRDHANRGFRHLPFGRRKGGSEQAVSHDLGVGIAIVGEQQSDEMGGVLRHGGIEFNGLNAGADGGLLAIRRNGIDVGERVASGREVGIELMTLFEQCGGLVQGIAVAAGHENTVLQHAGGCKIWGKETGVAKANRFAGFLLHSFGVALAIVKVS